MQNLYFFWLRIKMRYHQKFIYCDIYYGNRNKGKEKKMYVDELDVNL